MTLTAEHDNIYVFLTIMFYHFDLDHPVNYIYMPYICEMRISAHNFNIETGRFYDLDGHERVRSKCNLNVVEDTYLPRLLSSLILCTDSNCTNLKHDNLSQ
jgi:hypothetical protein